MGPRDMTYAQWAARWPQAASELHELLAPPVPPAPHGTPTSEAYVQSTIRLEAPARGVMLFRNNAGAMTDETGRLVRYGLGHESKPFWDRVKSSDLIGWRKLLITPEWAGRTVAQFVSRECKPAGWHMTPGDARAQAQAAWLAMVARDGGDACFASGVGTL